MEKRVNLNLASRIMLNKFFNNVGNAKELKADDMVFVGECRECFDLQEAEKVVAGLRREILITRRDAEQAYQLVVAQAEAIENTVKRVQALQAANDLADKFEALPQRLELDKLRESDVQTFKIDDAYLDWLLEFIKGYAWNQVQVRGPQGFAMETIGLEVSEQQAIAELHRSLKGAETVKAKK